MVATLQCTKAERCPVDGCPHKVPHKPIHNGGFNYSYHTCEHERTLMCASLGDNVYMDSDCQPVK